MFVMIQKDLYRIGYRSLLLFLKVIPVLMILDYLYSLLTKAAGNLIVYKLVFAIPLGMVQAIILTPISIHFLSQLKNERLPLASYYRRILLNFHIFALTNLLMNAIVILNLLLLVIPGIRKAFQYFFVNLAFTYEEKDGFSALNRSIEIAKGSWWLIFFEHLATTIPFGIVIFILQHFLHASPVTFALLESLFISIMAILSFGLTGVLYHYIGNRYYA